ncbi:MAG: glycosyltransferase family 39 protein [Campylobacterota bacterium]|nr:glycosyltransferase family 39 protein [Campylobacterota bacterium]
MILNRYNYSFIALILFHFCVLLFTMDGFSISYKESLIYFQGDSILHIITNFSTSLFGQTDFALRFPFILFYIGSSILLYLLTDDYFKSQWDRVFCLSIFMILPGLNSAALLVNESIIVVFGTLLYLYLYKIREKEHYYLLILFLFVDNSFAILFLALFFYSLKKRDNTLLLVSLVLFGTSMSIYGFEVGGRPRGYLIDTFGVYATIFSPLLFLYFFFSLYRIGLKWEKDMYWYVAITALALSLVFSLRQKIAIEDFAPFVVIAIPIMVKLFMHSIRVRLKEFRKVHYTVASITLLVLIINFFIFIFNQYLYLFLENNKKHFAYDYHIVKDLSYKLKDLNISNVHTKDKELALRLQFYKIYEGEDYLLTSENLNSFDKEIKINYHKKDIETFRIKELPK